MLESTRAANDTQSSVRHKLSSVVSLQDCFWLRRVAVTVKVMITTIRAATAKPRAIASEWMKWGEGEV